MRTLVLDGGGMRGAFTVGVLDAFLDKGINYEYFDNYIGTSAGACTMSYFLTDQYKEEIKIWTDLVPKGFIKWHGIIPYNDIKYLENIFRKEVPLSCKILSERKQKAFVSLTNPDTSKTEYICLNTAKDPIAVILVGIAMPFFSHPGMLHNHPYYDGGITSAVPFKYAEELGSDEIWVVLTTPKGYRRNSMQWKIASWLAGKDSHLRKLIAERPKHENPVLEEIEKRKDLVVIRPKHSLPVHWRKNDRDKIIATIELGKQAANKMLKKIKI